MKYRGDRMNKQEIYERLTFIEEEIKSIYELVESGEMTVDEDILKEKYNELEEKIEGFYDLLLNEHAKIYELKKQNEDFVVLTSEMIIALEEEFNYNRPGDRVAKIIEKIKQKPIEEILKEV